MVTHACHRVRSPRYFPTAEVLRANREAEVLCSIWGAFLEVRGTFVGVVELIGYFFAVDGGFVRIEFMSCVNGCERFLVRGCHGNVQVEVSLRWVKGNVCAVVMVSYIAFGVICRDRNGAITCAVVGQGLV